MLIGTTQGCIQSCTGTNTVQFINLKKVDFQEILDLLGSEGGTRTPDTRIMIPLL
jgi:hypothetical protein